MWYIHTVEYNLAFKNKEILPFDSAMWMNLEDFMLSKVSQT
jgi:hypothetical protein